MGFEVYYRTHTCGELDIGNVGQQVTLAGWVNRRRDHGGLIFIDVRDRYGITQVICDPERSAEAHRVASELRSEYVVQVAGTVVRRLPGTENPHLHTGAIEIAADRIEILNRRAKPDAAGDVRRPGLKLVRQFIVHRFFKCDRLDHVASPLVWRHRLEQM